MDVDVFQTSTSFYVPKEVSDEKIAIRNAPNLKKIALGNF